MTELENPENSDQNVRLRRLEKKSGDLDLRKREKCQKSTEGGRTELWLVIVPRGDSWSFGKKELRLLGVGVGLSKRIGQAHHMVLWILQEVVKAQ